MRRLLYRSTGARKKLKMLFIGDLFIFRSRSPSRFIGTPPPDHAMVLFRNSRYCPISPAIIPSGRSTRTVPRQSERVSLKVAAGERFVCPLVTYPIRPRNGTPLPEADPGDQAEDEDAGDKQVKDRH